MLGKRLLYKKKVTLSLDLKHSLPERHGAGVSSQQNSIRLQNDYLNTQTWLLHTHLQSSVYQFHDGGHA